ncbi:HNH endonuclease [Mogibacterium timidum]|uniref:HNH endonuclease n=1 Tax=Mogibacterium timidum TaxID=35519 RepID=UPI0028DC193B|nr:HNH endonuclease [Mogibacterium timidum]
MKKCVICGELLSVQNKSKEHIIHNAIGGSLEDDEIYCKSCNESCGSNNDKAFTKIFAPIVSKIKMHKTRKTKGTIYTGTVRDQEGNLYTATYKGSKIVKLEDRNAQHVEYKKGKFETLYYHFDLDNIAFKMGFSKIAFNYAIHCGLPVSRLEKVFNNTTKKFVEKPVVIPFIPLSLFDNVMEKYQTEKIYHVVRIFNNGIYLYAYIELFNTFQFYVLLSDKYTEYIDKSYANVVEMNEPLDETLKDDLTPRNYKDMDIIKTQYKIDITKQIENLKNFHNYNCLDENEKINALFNHIGKIAYEQIRKESYIKKYEELINKHYDSIEFKNEFLIPNDIERMSEFFNSFQFYTIYENDCVRIEKYKRFLPDGSDYIHAICNIINSGKKLDHYGHMKFNMLMSRLD